jgi:uncharacterized glyoxalase superfamily protein PhnB
MHTVIPNLIFRDCADAIEFYKKALGAEELSRFPSPDGKQIWHAALRIGESIVFVNDRMPGMKESTPTPESPSPISMWMYVPDCDAVFNRAVAAGANGSMPPADMFWGDRVAGIGDPYGYSWSFATHQKDLSPEEMRRGAEEFARSMPASR